MKKDRVQEACKLSLRNVRVTSITIKEVYEN